MIYAVDTGTGRKEEKKDTSLSSLPYFQLPNLLISPTLIKGRSRARPPPCTSHTQPHGNSGQIRAVVALLYHYLLVFSSTLRIQQPVVRHEEMRPGAGLEEYVPRDCTCACPVPAQVSGRGRGGAGRGGYGLIFMTWRGTFVWAGRGGGEGRWMGYVLPFFPPSLLPCEIFAWVQRRLCFVYIGC
jgi:hypothetical protein